MDKPLALIIEDDKNLANAFGEALEDAGYQAEIIFDGQTALNRLKEIVPAIVVLDLHIPVVQGSEVLKYIRADERLMKLRVIIATADDLEAAYVGKLANLVLLKPVTYQQLRDLSARWRPKESNQ